MSGRDRIRRQWAIGTALPSSSYALVAVDCNKELKKNNRTKGKEWSAA